MKKCTFVVLLVLLGRTGHCSVPADGELPPNSSGLNFPQHNNSVTEERTVTSEERSDGIHHKVTITRRVRVPFMVHVEKRIPKIVQVPVDKPFNVYVPKPYPVIVEKKVPFEVKVPVPQPYTVEKKVPYPVKVLVDKPYPVHVPKPYPVEVEKKYEFPVEKKIPYAVKVPVERPYPVHLILEKEVKFPVEKKIPIPVQVPYEKPIPISVTKHVPVPVEKPVPYKLEKVITYPVHVPLKIPVQVHYPEGGEGVVGGGWQDAGAQSGGLSVASSTTLWPQQNTGLMPNRLAMSGARGSAQRWNPHFRASRQPYAHFHSRQPQPSQQFNSPRPAHHTAYEVNEVHPLSETVSFAPYLRHQTPSTFNLPTRNSNEPGPVRMSTHQVQPPTDNYLFSPTQLGRPSPGIHNAIDSDQYHLVNSELQQQPYQVIPVPKQFSSSPVGLQIPVTAKIPETLEQPTVAPSSVSPPGPKSFIGSKTFVGNQELTFATSIQHKPLPIQQSTISITQK